MEDIQGVGGRAEGQMCTEVGCLISTVVVWLCVSHDTGQAQI